MSALASPFYIKSMVDAKHTCKKFYHSRHASFLPRPDASKFQKASLQIPMSPHARSLSAGVVLSLPAIDGDVLSLQSTGSSSHLRNVCRQYSLRSPLPSIPILGAKHLSHGELSLLRRG